MNSLLDPNVGYTLLVGGLLLSILALLIPGTGLFELAALFALVSAGYIMLQLPVNAWAFVMMAAALIPLYIAIRNKRSLPPLILAGALLLIGSLFVFRNENGGPAVHPLVATLVSVGAVGLVWLISRKAWQAAGIQPSHDLERLFEAEASAVTDLNPEGSVYVLGENWSAIAETPIPAGSRVRVLRREGLVLYVEPAAEPEAQEDSQE